MLLVKDVRSFLNKHSMASAWQKGVLLGIVEEGKDSHPNCMFEMKPVNEEWGHQIMR